MTIRGRSPIQRAGTTSGADVLEETFRPPEKRRGVVAKRAEFTDSPEFLRDPSQQAQWIASRMGHENLATRPDVAERARAVISQELAATRTTLEYLRNKWLILYRLYRGESLTKHFYGRSSVHVPEPFKAVETIVPRLISSLFDIEPWHKVVGRTKAYDASAQLMQSLIDQQVYEIDLVRRAERICRNLAIYGTSPGYTMWRQEIRNVQYRKTRRLPDPSNPGRFVTRMEDVSREEVVFDGNDYAPIELWDYFAPPLSPSVDEAEWAAHRRLYSFDEVREMGKAGLWENLRQLDDAVGDDHASFDDEFKQRKAYSIGVWDPNAELQAAGIGHFEVLERWGLFDIEGDGNAEVCQIIAIQPAGRTVIVRVCRNPYWHGEKPYVVPRYITLEGEHFGIGVIEPIAKLSMELDQKRQLELAGTQLASNPMLIAVDGANIPDEQLIATPGLVLRAPTADGIKPLFIPDVSDAAIKSQNRITSDIRETTGAVTTMMGGSERGEETAYEVRSRMNESNVRIRGAIGNMEREFIIPLMQRFDWNNQQFQNTPKVVRAIGYAGLKWASEFVVTPEKITGQFNHVALAGHRLNQQFVQVQQLVNMLDRAPALNMAQPGMIRLPQLVAKILQEGFGIRDVDELVELDTEDTRALSAWEEHEAWKQGVVPPIHERENLLRHAKLHQDFVNGEEFAQIERDDPGTAAKVQAHIATTMAKIARLYEQQEQQLMLAAQARSVRGEEGGKPGGRGFNEPGQSPGSPNFRSEHQDEKAESAASSPNEGAS